MSVTDKIDKLGGSLTIEDYECGAGDILYVAAQKFPTLLLGAPVPQRSRHLFVSVDQRRHGDPLLLSMYLGQRSWQITTGSWELLSFIPDPDTLHVLYPDIQEHSIVTFDLRSHQARRLALPNGDELELLDEARDRSLIAYTVYGPCRYGDKDTPSRAWWQKNVCFVQPQ